MFARTERLLLRPPWPEDAPALAAALDDPAIARNLAQVSSPYALADAAAFVARAAAAPLPQLLIFSRTWGAPRLVGGIGLEADASGAVELGFWITRPCWGLGFATEAGRATVAFACDGLQLPALVAGHAIDNPAARNVLVKLGFAATGEVTPQACLGRAEPFACARYRLQLRVSRTRPAPALAA